jgi:nickel transport protein
MTRRWHRILSPVAVSAAVVLALAGPAAAHRLKLFVTAEDGEIGGYAFFVGGGRPEGVEFVVKDGGGREVFRGRTDDRGNFRWRPSLAADYAITVDAGDGHWVEGRIEADRLASAIVPTASGAAPVATPPASPPPSASPPVSASLACPAPFDPAMLSRLVAAEVDRAVARQVRPLIEAQDQAEGRVRFNDVMGGIGMIAGLAGAWSWAVSRRRRREP